MQHSCFRLEKQHVGQKTLRIEGRRVRLPFRIRTEDIGREVCFTPNGAIRLSALQITADQYPYIHEICRSMSLHPVQHVLHRKYAIGDPQEEYEVTPWFVSVVELEGFLRRHFGAYRPVSSMVQ